tara:strand:+ start:10 stop:144 length:135 start_codon:yes stop_codon:yes gene_type:complete
MKNIGFPIKTKISIEINNKNGRKIIKKIKANDLSKKLFINEYFI